MLDEIARIALGWLGWTEEQLLYSDINVIRVAFRGRVEMLQQIFGSSEEDKDAVGDFKPIDKMPGQRSGGNVIPLTPALFDRHLGKT